MSERVLPPSLLARAAARWRQAGRRALFWVVPGAVLGAGLGAWWWQQDIESLQHLREEVVTLQSKLQPEPVKAPTTATAPVRWTDWPDAAGGAAVWPWLLQGLQVQALQVQSLRPGAVEWVAGLPEQTVVLEVQGRWSDWLAFERQLDRHAPWWTPLQWQVVPAAGADQVRMQWHWRWAWRPESAQARHAFAPPLWAPATSDGRAVLLFEGPGSAAETAAANLPEPASGPDPSSWAVQSLRLLGIWQQEGVAHAVLGHGPDRVVLAVGQRVGRTGHRLVHVGEAQAVLQAPERSEPPLHLVLTGGVR